jgi:hypothetical protein
MNITMNDLEINAVLDQSAMAELAGGLRRYGSWVRTSTVTGAFQKGPTHMGSWFRTSLFTKKRYGHQHGKIVKTYNYRRNVTDYAFG